MSVPSAEALREALAAALRLETLGKPAGNVSIARGVLGGRSVHAALIENHVASGAIGVAEADRLAAAFRVAGLERSPLVLYVDSAGAKVSEGLAALGGFRHLFRAGLDAALAGAPIAAVLGRNTFGGASMLACLARERLFAPATRFGMSGPAVIAAASGLDPLDEAFRAMAEAAMSATARAKASDANTGWQPAMDLVGWLRKALAPVADPVGVFRARHEALTGRRASPAPLAWEAVRRRDLERMYPAGYEARECRGFLEGTGRTDVGEEALLGLVGTGALDADRAWHFAEAAWKLGGAKSLRVLLDCATHATRLEEERLVLSEYVVDMSLALAVAARHGTRVRLTIAGKAGGGVYVAIAAPADEVASVPGAEIHVLPGSAVAAILGSSRESVPSFADYRDAGVADQELKLGIVPQ